MEEWLPKLQAEKQVGRASVLRRGGLEVKLSAPKGADVLTRHPSEVLYLVAAGSGSLFAGGKRTKFVTGDALFVPAETTHRFEDFTNHIAVWVVFHVHGVEKAENRKNSNLCSGETRLGRIPGNGNRSLSSYRRGAFRITLYAPCGHDTQTQSGRNELQIVARGHGQAKIGNERCAIGPADILFIPEGTEYHFEDSTKDFAIWAIGACSNQSAKKRFRS
ncbi:MAG: cupin domain-containing protein [Alphaproteobacteria bacterium]